MSIRKSSHRFVLAIVVIIAISAVSYASPWTAALEFLGLSAPAETVDNSPAPQVESPSMMVTTVTTNGGSGLNPTYPDLVSAITALNAIPGGVTSSPTTITVTGTETAPSGGYTITATGTVANPIVIDGQTTTTITAFTPQTSGVLHDAIFEIVGGDYITINGFTMLEDPANTTTSAGTNNMTEFGVALFYATTTNGAQNNTISNNTIDLNRTYQNTFAIYSNSTHSSTVMTTTASATTTAGGNSGLTITGNSMTDVNNGVVIVGPTAAADFNDPITIGGTAPNANTLTNFGTTGTFSGYANVSGTVNGILVRNSKNVTVSFNSITSSVGGVTVGTINGIQFPAFSATPTGTFTQSVNNNTISLQSGLIAGAITGITMPSGSASATSVLNVNNNNFATFGHTVAGTGSITFITNASVHLTHSISNNTFTNISVNTTGSVTFISNSNTLPAAGLKNVNNNSIVTAFNKTGAGGTITLFTDNGSDPSGTTNNSNNNNFSNITVTGATTIAGWLNTNGGTPTKSVTGNTFSNWVGGTSAITGLTVSFSGNSTVSGNTVSGISCACAITGITSASGTLENFTSNTVHTLTSTGAFAVTGMSNTGGTTKNFSKNKIYNLENSNVGITTAGTVTGFLVSGGTTVNVFNNLVGDLRAPSSNGSDIIRGLSVTSTTTSSTINASFNSIYLNASSIGASFGTSGVFHAASATATTAALTLRNNIIVNTSTPNIGGGSITTAAFRRSTGGASTLANYGSASNNNLFYAGTPGPNRLIYDDGLSIAQTIAAYKAGVFTAGTIAPRDSASISENPPFLSTTGSSANFLHIDTSVATQIESGGITVAGITDDFDGNVRNVSTPDIGADEFAGTGLDLSPPTVNYTALGNTASLGNRVLTTSITDATGVPTAGVGLPVLYWKINAGAYVPVTATYISGSQYDFTFGAGVVATDVVSYYIVAQDTAGTPNVGSTPSGGSGFTINPPAASTPPGSPSTYTVIPTISGTKTVGAGGDYLTLTAAIAAINAAEVNGPVVLSLTDASYTTPAETFPLVLNANGGSSATNTITIVPAASNVTSITGAAASGCLIRLNGADYVTIDGSNSGGTDRSLTLTNTSTTSPATVCISSLGTGAGATNNTVKNTNISTGSNAATSYGIAVGGVAPGTTGADNDSTTLDNNAITRASNGIFVGGTAGVSVGGNDGLSITSNLVGPASAGVDNISLNGIILSNAVSPNISSNTVRNVVSTSSTVSGIAVNGGVTGASVTQNSVSGVTTSPSSTTSYGMFIGTGSTGATISRNVVTNISQTSTGGYPARGLYVATGSATAAVSISNNSISDIRSYSDPNTAFSFQPVGIFIAGSQGGINLYYNSVNLFGSNPGLTSATLQAAVYIGTSVTALDLRNNVFRNSYDNSSSGTDKSYSIYSDSANTAFTIINYNDYFVSGTPGVLGFLGSDRIDLAGIQAGFGQNLSSINANPLFNTDTNLQPGSGSPLLLAGTPIGGITTDILGVTRDVTTPTIGAYETVADVGGPTISYAPLPNTSSLLDTAITATITDPSGVPTSGGNRPRVYFKRSVDASYVSRVCTFSAGTYNCGLLYAALPGAPVVGDTIQYFIIAQDNIGNVSSNPSGVVATNVNTVTTPPTPNSYNILLEINSYPYTQNFEGGAGGYTSAIVGGSVNDWILGTPAKTQLSAAHSGTNAWVTKLTGTYSSSHNAAVVSPIFNFTSVASTATISFWQNFDISGDPDYDSMVLEASTDGGTVWNRVDSTVGTGGTFDTANSTGWYNFNGVEAPILGPEWTDTSTGYTGHTSGWIQSTTKVGALAGQASVLLRWRFASDSSVVDEGFAIDDIAVTPLVVAPGNLQLSSATYGGNENTTVNIDVNRVSGSSGTVGVTYSFTDGTATGGAACGGSVDYVNTGGTLTFVDSDILETISVSLCPDATIDPGETFSVTLSAPTGGAGLGTPTAATVTITDVPPPLSGTYNVPGDYPSLTNPGGIFEAINNSGTTAAVTINIAADLTAETGVVALNQIASGFGVTVQPSGAARLIEGSNTTGLINMNGADNVVFTGTPFGSTGLTIRNTSATTGGVFRFVNDASTNGIVNSLIEQNNTASTAVLFGAGTTTGNDDNQINGTTIRGTSSTVMPFNSIASVGTSSAISNGNLNITNNTLTDFGQAGVLIGSGSNTATVSGNDISQTASRTTVVFGIYASGTTGTHVISSNRIHGLTSDSANATAGVVIGDANASISENRIYDIQTTATATGLIVGIEFDGVSGGTPSVSVVNNFISIAPAIASAQRIYGIRDYGYGGNIFTADHNSVYIGGTGSGASSTWALVRGDFAPTTFTAQNNIAFNNRTGGTGNHFAGGDQSAGTGTFVANGNFYAGTGATAANFMDYGSSSSGTPVSFATYQAGPPARDAASTGNTASTYTESNIFVNTATGDLHLKSTAGVDILSTGITLGSVTADIDLDPRPVAPDKGADEIVQSVAGSFAGGSFYNAVLAEGDTLSDNVSVFNTLYLTGESNTGANTLSLGCNTTVVGAGGGNYVVGSVQKDFCSTGSFTFPVGTVSNGTLLGTPPEYTPMTANITAGTFPSSLTVNVVDDFLPGLVQPSAVSRYWTVTETGNLTADMTFTYLDPTDVNGNEANYKVFRRSGGVTAEATPNNNNPAGNTATVLNVSNFSDWGIGALVPTAAEVSISGRVTTSSGAGIKNAAIVVTGNGLPRPIIAKTASLGYYMIEGLQAGETYVVTVVSKRFTFQVPSRVISLTDSVDDIDFVADPQQ